MSLTINIVYFPKQHNLAGFSDGGKKVKGKDIPVTGHGGP
jgi:hypothetical protein